MGNNSRFSHLLRGTLGRVSLVILMVSLPSCSEKRYDPVPLYPVSGQFLYQGKPVDGAFVKFTPVEGAGEPGALTAQGETDSEGNFTLSTYEKGDGAPSGRYAVTIVWPTTPANPMRSQDPGPDRLERRYSDPNTSPWQVETQEGDNVLDPFVIEASRE